MPEPSNLSNEDLKWGYWYFLHQGAIKRLAAIIIGAVGLMLLVYSSWQWIDWLTSRRAEDEAIRVLAQNSVNYTAYHQRIAPLLPEVGMVTAVPAGGGLYDLVAQVKNPNLKWAAQELPFTFSAGGENFSGSSFLMPNEDKYLVNLGAPLSGAPSQVSLTFGNIKWKRIRDLTTFPLVEFGVTGEKIELVEGLLGSPTSTRLRVSVTNKSAYNFWEVPVTVILSRSNSVQAVGRQTIKDFLTGQSVPLEFIWSGTLPMPDHLVVKPEVNLVDSKSFKPL